eukprot:CAMPEP_0201937464 /NCGR_PEP_ID=MMETSP0903-20130614/39547_1 /ASSEMBLY_ACC=CAM_ASM_000552 /TAXON_ID=420261 /ORGANISM="Thalassiosira antarctica, Strain CCMP982" /LENGTH=491 /DNA_ID=CAMNT_0048478453 /DNA_START=77 /DNA_END=1552 /DNA_ORIENTATION=+
MRPKKSSCWCTLVLSAVVLTVSSSNLLLPSCSALQRRPSSPLNNGVPSSMNHHGSAAAVSNVHNSNPRELQRSTINDDKQLSIRGGGDSIIPQTQRRKLVVLLVATALFNDMLQLTMLLPIIHTLISSPPPLGVTTNKEVALGIFFASKDICQMSFAPLAAILTSKTSANTALIVSTVGLGLATFVFAEATTFWQLLLARGAQGAASAAVMCGGMSLIAETHPQNIRGSAMGLAQTGLAFGLLCGPLIGGLLFQRLGRRRTFRLAAGIVLANAAAMVGLMGLAPPERTEQKEKNGKKSSLVASSKRLLVNHDILAVTASTFIIHAVLGVIKPLSQVVLDTEFGMTMMKRSFVISIATVAYFITAPFSGWLSDRMSRPRLVALSLVLMSGSSAFFALRHLGIWAFYTCVALLGVALGVQKSSSTSLLADLVDKHELGEYSVVYALSDVADSLGLIIGPIVGLWLSQVFSHSVGVLAIGALCLLLAPVVLRIQ